MDEFGGLDDAIAHAAELTGIEDQKYRLIEYPKTKDKIEEIIAEITGQKPAEAMIKSQLGDYYPYYRQAKQINQMQGIQARIPYEFKLVNKNSMLGK